MGDGAAFGVEFDRFDVFFAILFHQDAKDLLTELGDQLGRGSNTPNSGEEFGVFL